MAEPDPEPPPMSPGKRRWLSVLAGLGVAMVAIPFFMSAIGIATASRVPEGLRGATHIPAMKQKVGFALGSASLAALLTPPGILLFVLSGLPLAEERRRRSRRDRR